MNAGTSQTFKSVDHLTAGAATIMVVEDCEETRLMLSLLLQMNGYVTTEAADGQEAIEVAQLKRPDLILMDLNLPVLDGLKATRRILERAEMRDVPVVAITAYGTPDYRLKAIAAGCSEFLTKPLNKERLEKTIKQLLPRNRTSPAANTPFSTPPARLAALSARAA
jgi:two-component system cell cycle response regulator DivK